jgi:hypothetical protein
MPLVTANYTKNNKQPSVLPWTVGVVEGYKRTTGDGAQMIKPLPSAAKSRTSNLILSSEGQLVLLLVVMLLMLILPQRC